ncbi:hypothetical protein GCM10007242_41690 [Pigmentiphaga litoralis]|nr:hypothetical protein GCM10007242_41690 [Pigmentiphaga litoralis]
MTRIETLESADWTQLCGYAVDAFDSGSLEDKKQVAAELNISKDEVSAVLNAATFLVALVTAFSEMSVDELAAALYAEELIPAENSNIRALLQAISQKQGAINDQMDKGQLANSTLPTLQRFLISVDVRLPASEEPLSSAVPVAVAMLDTDLDSSLSFQMTKKQVQLMMKRLEDALQQFERAEKLIGLASSRSDI